MQLPWKPREDVHTAAQGEEFDPSRVVRVWKKDGSEVFRISDALTGVAVFGATGSGKTSGPAKHLAYGYLATGFGGLVLCAKKEERDQWVKWAFDTHREQDLVVINTGGARRFNFLNWEADRPGDGGGLTINIVTLLDQIAKAITNDAGDGQGDNRFFTDALRHMNTNLVDLVIFSGLQLSLPLMREIVLTAPQNLDEAKAQKWQQESVCAAVLREAAAQAATMDDGAKADFAECDAYWKFEYPQLAFKTRSIITLMFSMLTRPFTTRPLRRLFCEDTNITPEETFEGRIILVDLPVQEYRLAGRVAAMAWKYCFQMAVMRRKKAPDGMHLRPVFLWADEAQNFVSDFDAEYQAVARSAGGCTVYLTQNRESYRRVLGNDDTTDALLGNLQAKFFCQNAGETNEWASKLFGERWMDIESSGFSSGTGENAANVSGHTSQQRRAYVEPSAFATLKRGGAVNNLQVETIVYNGGHQFIDPDTGERVPMKLLRFNQK
jgi:hypothetical protein